MVRNNFAKQYIGQYVLQITEMKASRPQKIYHGNCEIRIPWAIQKENCRRVGDNNMMQKEIIYTK